ncbi:MAG: hypothetical protein M0C28_01110 [Candidatus Moduliflexus flocculans]|nr:hypothetical protein [Candidatus Moduliflexus flocculans]
MRRAAHDLKTDPKPKSNFVRDIVDERPRGRDASTAGPHPLPARAQRLPPHRPRQVHLPQLRHGRATTAGRCNLRFDDTNPAKEEHGVRRLHQGGRPLARLRLGGPRCSTPPTTSSSSTTAP